MTNALTEALTANRKDIEREMGVAEQELADLRAREHELEALVRRARVTLGIESPSDSHVDEHLTLHAAMVKVLQRRSEAGMTAAEIAGAIRSERLYVRRDGGPVDQAQIYARLNNYSQLFEKSGGIYRLRKQS